MGYQQFHNLVFRGLLSYNKAFGQIELNTNGEISQFDYVANVYANDIMLRVKEVNILYLGKDFLVSGLD